MLLKRENRYSRPLGVTIISTLFLIGGLLALLISIGLCLSGAYILTHLGELEKDGIGIGLLAGAFVFIGFAGLVLSSLTVLSGFGLRKMRRWGLWCNYYTTALVILINIYIIGVIGLRGGNLTAIYVAAMTSSIAIGISIYLKQAYAHRSYHPQSPSSDR
jgi:hypothetical protein